MRDVISFIIREGISSDFNNCSDVSSEIENIIQTTLWAFQEMCTSYVRIIFLGIFYEPGKVTMQTAQEMFCGG